MFDIIFSVVYYGKQGLATFDAGYVDYLLTAKLNQEAVYISVAKTGTGFCERVPRLYIIVYLSRQTEAVYLGKISISLLILKRIKGGRDKNVSTLQYHES